MRSALVIVAVLLSSRTFAAPTPGAAAEKPRAQAAAAARVQVAFKLDPLLSGPTYGGERWVSPQTYRGASAQHAVEARATAVDGRGRRLAVELQWKPADPEMVTVTPPRGDRVQIAVKRPGETRVTVGAAGATRTLNVKATRDGGTWQVSISQ
jgi:hypothetical protein